LDPRGKLKVNADWNKDLKIKFTVQDPCQIVRKSFGDPIAEDLRPWSRRWSARRISSTCTPTAPTTTAAAAVAAFCSPGIRRSGWQYGRLKDEQIQATKADYCIAACHNCHAQIHELSEHFGGGYGVVHLWTLICLSLGILESTSTTTSRRSTSFTPKRPCKVACDDSPGGRWETRAAAPPGGRVESIGMQAGGSVNDTVSIAELERRWQSALSATGRAVAEHPALYARLKSQASAIVDHPLDVEDYLAAARLLADLLDRLDPQGGDSIFHRFKGRIAPADIWQVRWLRLECRDLLAHLAAFDRWRCRNGRLRVVK
jgi:hypothetical protein